MRRQVRALPQTLPLVQLALSLARLQDESPSAATARELRATLRDLADVDTTAVDAAEEARRAAQGG